MKSQTREELLQLYEAKKELLEAIQRVENELTFINNALGGCYPSYSLSPRLEELVNTNYPFHLSLEEMVTEIQRWGVEKNEG